MTERDSNVDWFWKRLGFIDTTSHALSLMEPEEVCAVRKIGVQAMEELGTGVQFDMDDPSHVIRVFGDTSLYEKGAFIKWLRLYVGLKQAHKDQ